MRATIIPTSILKASQTLIVSLVQPVSFGTSFRTKRNRPRFPSTTFMQVHSRFLRSVDARSEIHESVVYLIYISRDRRLEKRKPERNENETTRMKQAKRAENGNRERQ